ncbi:MAG: alpha-amylase/4-alpha-glucanotransferase domain-containing protein [Candidatus Omnitrophota bacterium]
MPDEKKLRLLLAVHCHQPVGNFGGVFQEAYEKAYLPFIQTLNRHPGINISLHYSGSLLDWLVSRHPEFIGEVKDLIREGRVEIIGGAYYEPIISVIPGEDAQGQIAMLSSFIRRHFDVEPAGGWLAERVWEPRIPHTLSLSGIKYTILDDWHFRLAGFRPEDVSGYYLTEEDSRTVSVFASCEQLRYLVPFKRPQETIDYLRLRRDKAKSGQAVVLGDDGEKFGLWPGTHKWVHRQGWLDEFFSLLEKNAHWIDLMKFDDYIAAYPPAGRVYLPCASYREMQEWSGGYFRNFFIKYPEGNFMHKRMLYLSRLISQAKDEMPENKIGRARRHLYMAQANCPYWHGVFGGLYLNHLRSAVYSNLIRAEKILDEKENKREHCDVKILDIDSDGVKEMLVDSRRFKFCFRPEQGAVICEWDCKDKALNLVNTIARRPERSHGEILSEKTEAAKGRNDAANPADPNIHRAKKIRDSGLKGCLFYDRNPRYCLLDHFLRPEASAQDFYRGEYEELGDFVCGRYDLESKMDVEGKRRKVVDTLNFRRCGLVGSARVEIAKTINISGAGMHFGYCLKNACAENIDCVFAAEFNLSIYDNLLSRGIGVAHSPLLGLNDIWNDVKLEFRFAGKTEVWHLPIETVSESEAAIERLYQELCLLFRWPISLSGQQSWQTEFELKVG